MSRLLIVGPPGAGKGTQGKIVAAELDIPAISTGDIFRYHMENGTDLGKRVKSIVDSGSYVSDELTNELVMTRLAEPDAANGFLLDGYPRTAPQVEALDAWLADQGHKLDGVLQLVADDDELVQRLLDRAQKEQRADDSEDVIRKRMAVYTSETAPILAVYQDRGLLVEVDGLGPVDQVTDRIVKAAKDAVGAAG